VIVLRVLMFVAGLAIVLFTIASVIRTFLVPRALYAHVSRAVFVGVRWLFRIRTRQGTDYAHRDQALEIGRASCRERV